MTSSIAQLNTIIGNLETKTNLNETSLNNENKTAKITLKKKEENQTILAPSQEKIWFGKDEDVPTDPSQFRYPNLDLFPHGIDISEAREAIKGRADFREIIGSDYSSFVYLLVNDDSFPHPQLASDEKTARLWQIRRECRGIIFSKSTGKVISRRFHKFFNVNEVSETKFNRVDLSKPYVILEKLDGSMISPFRTEGQIKMGSKQGAETDVAKQCDLFIQQSNQKAQYYSFSEKWINKNYTPIFEFVSPKFRIVMEYPEESLRLIGLRNNEDGEYVAWKELEKIAAEEGVPLVGEVGKDEKKVNLSKAKGDPLNFELLVQEIRKQIGFEGFVIRFDDGKMIKIKTNWYFELSKKLDLVKNPNEKHLWKFVLDNEYDDVKSFLPAHLRDKYDRFASDLIKNLEATAKRIQQGVEDYKKKENTADVQAKNKRIFSDWVRKEIPEPERAVWYALYEGADPIDNVVMTVKRNIGDITKLNKIRPLAGGIVLSQY